MRKQKVNSTLTDRITKAAQEEVAKSGILQFRAEPELIQKVYQIATEKKVRVSSLLRDWVTEKASETDNQDLADILLRQPNAPVTHAELFVLLAKYMKHGDQMDAYHQAMRRIADSELKSVTEELLALLKKTHQP